MVNKLQYGSIGGVNQVGSVKRTRLVLILVGASSGEPRSIYMTSVGETLGTSRKCFDLIFSLETDSQ